MSNVIKTSHLEDSKRLLIAKPIVTHVEVSSQDEVEAVIDEKESLEEAKKGLQEDIIQLKGEYSRLQEKMKIEAEEVKSEMVAWEKIQKQEAQLKAEQMMTEAEQQGFEKGYEKGYRQALNEWEDKNNEITQIVSEAYEQKKKVIEEAEPFLLQLSVKIAQKILYTELEQEPEKLVKMVQHSLMQVSEQGEIILQVSPTDYSMLNPYMEELKQFVQPGSELKLLPDYSYVGQGCMIHTSNGSYDVTLDSQLNELKKKLLNSYEECADQ